MKDHITEIQQYLRTISFYNSSIPRIIPNGTYDWQTKNSVQAFQQEYSLPITGQVDEATWYKLVSEYLIALEYISEPVGIQPFPNDGSSLSLGSSGTAVIMLQAMLAELSKTYGNVRPAEITGHFSKDDEQTIKFMRTVLGMTPGGSVDIFLWNRIVNLFNNEIAEKKS